MEDAPGYTGEVLRMRESYGEDAASHPDPTSWTVLRKDGRAALTGACAGGLVSRAILLVRGADAVSISGRPPAQPRPGEATGRRIDVLRPCLAPLHRVLAIPAHDEHPCVMSNDY